MHLKTDTIRSAFWALALVIQVAGGVGVARAEPSPDQTEEGILVIGSSPMLKGNMARAKASALSNAMAKGLERYLIQVFGKEGMVKNFPVILEDLLPTASEAVENFNILAQRQGGDRFTILVRLKINEKVTQEKLKQLGLVVMDLPPLRTLLLVSQQGPQGDAVAYWWREPEFSAPLSPIELTLSRACEDIGLSPLNRMGTQGDAPEDLKVLDLSYRQAAEWGKRLSAELVIQGACALREDGTVSLLLTALDPETEALVARDRREGRLENGLADREGLMALLGEISRKAVSELSSGIRQAVSGRNMGTSRLDLSVTGLRDYRQFIELRAFIEKRIPGVLSFMQTGIKGTTFGVRIEFQGTDDAFIRSLRAGTPPVPLDVTRSNEGEIILRVR